jgi:hypothetical protein
VTQTSSKVSLLLSLSSSLHWLHSNISLQGKIIGLGAGGAASIGDVVTVCIGRTALEFSDAQLTRWLECFGKVEGRFNYHLDKAGLKTDNIEVELKLSAHIPEFIPMYGRKIRVFYNGMQRQCNNCLGLGHFKADCKDNKRDWFSFVEELMESEVFEPDLFGDWPEIIKTKRNLIKQNAAESKSGGLVGTNPVISKGRGRGRGKS